MTKLDWVFGQGVLHHMMIIYSYYIIIDLCFGLIKKDYEYLSLWNTKWQLAVFYWYAYIMKGI